MVCQQSNRRISHVDPDCLGERVLPSGVGGEGVDNTGRDGL